jgi:hypothetical protein
MKSSKQKIFLIVLIPLTLVFLVPVAYVSAGQLQYTPLSPLPGTTVGDCPLDPNTGLPVNPEDPSCKAKIESYIPTIFQLAIGLAGAFAVVMIVVGGVQYLSSDAISGKSAGKERIQNALIGLLLAIGAFIILNTINPKALSLNLGQIGPIDGAPTFPDDLTLPDPENYCKIWGPGGDLLAPCSCINCVVIGSDGVSPYNSIPLKPGSGASTTQSLADKLVDFAGRMNGTDWRVTEAWKPTVGHQSLCHINGSCVDASLDPGFSNTTFTGSPASLFTIIPKIKKFFAEASASGLRAEFEVRTQAEIDLLRNLGVTGIIKLIPQISAPHWSIYP